MAEIPVGGAFAEYRGRRLRIAFHRDGWVALRANPGPAVPDGFESGESHVGYGYTEPWVKVPKTALDGIVALRVTGKIAGQTVSLQKRMPDGRISVEFIGPPAIARQIGMEGDQYMGWSGLFEPEVFEDIEVEETRRA